MRSKKEFSKCCKRCGEEWLPDFSNKFEKRALCLKCGREEYQEYKKVRLAKLEGVTRKIELMQPYKQENRQAHWTKVNKEIRKLKKLDEIHAFIKKQADEIFADKALMEFINHQTLK